MSNVYVSYHLLVDDQDLDAIAAEAHPTLPDTYHLTIGQDRDHHLAISGNGQRLTELVRKLGEALAWTIHEHERTSPLAAIR